MTADTLTVNDTRQDALAFEYDGKVVFNVRVPDGAVIRAAEIVANKGTGMNVVLESTSGSVQISGNTGDLTRVFSAACVYGGNFGERNNIRAVQSVQIGRAGNELTVSAGGAFQAAEVGKKSSVYSGNSINVSAVGSNSFMDAAVSVLIGQGDDTVATYSRLGTVHKNGQQIWPRLQA